MARLLPALGQALGGVCVRLFRVGVFSGRVAWSSGGNIPAHFHHRLGRPADAVVAVAALPLILIA